MGKLKSGKVSGTKKNKKNKKTPGGTFSKKTKQNIPNRLIGYRSVTWLDIKTA